MSNIDKRALRKAAMHAKTTDDWGCDADNFHDKATPDVVLALLDELEAGEKRIAELEAREVKLSDINNYLSDVTEPTLDRALRLTAKGVRSGDMAAIRAAGIRIKGED